METDFNEDSCFKTNDLIVLIALFCLSLNSLKLIALLILKFRNNFNSSDLLMAISSRLGDFRFGIFASRAC